MDADRSADCAVVAEPVLFAWLVGGEPAESVRKGVTLAGDPLEP